MVEAIFIMTAMLVFFSLACSLWALIKRGLYHRWWGLIAALLSTGIVCFIIRALSQSYVDADGLLHEYFALIPVGYLFSFTGIVGSLILFNIEYLSSRK